MSQRPQRFSLSGHDGDAIRAALVVGLGIEASRRDDQARPDILRDRVIAAIGAACDLQIDQPVLQPVAAHHFAHHRHERSASHRHRYREFFQAAFQPVEVSGLVQQQTVIDRAHFVDGVGELQAAIFDMDRRARVREITAVDIGDAALGPCTLHQALKV